MASKFYRSSRGQQVDVSSLLLQQENTRAVGNMGVNARGDKIDSNNKVVKSRNQQIDNQYAKQAFIHRVFGLLSFGLKISILCLILGQFAIVVEPLLF